MSSYNDTIVPRIAEYISMLVSKLGLKDKKERSVALDNYRVIVGENHSIDHLIKEKLTEEFIVLFNFRIVDKDGTVNNQEVEFRFPKMINNLFVIEGKLRVPTSVLVNDWTCRIYKDKIVLNSDIHIKPIRSSGTLLGYEIGIYDDEESRDLNYYPLTEELFEERKEFLKLDLETRLKLQIKLDVDEVPEYLTKEIVDRLVELPLDTNEDSIVDKRIMTIEDNLMSSLYRRSVRWSILASMRSKFYTYDGIYLRDISKRILNYFRLSGDKTIEIPSKVNPLVYDSLKNKIVISTHTAYNKTFTDLIDVVNTPENNNVNRINELNKCCKLVNGVIHIDCYEFKTGKKIRIPYLEYLNKKVLLNHQYDYENKVIKDLEVYEYKLRLKNYFTTDLNKVGVDLIEPSPDEKLSITTRQIPLIDKSDSVRVAMGISMVKQAVEVYNSEPRLVYSGNEEEDVLESSSLTKYNLDSPAVVTSITDDKVFYQIKSTGSIMYFDILPPSVGINNTIISYVTKVKVGDTLNKGDVVITPKIMSRGSYELGLNTFVFYMSYLGYTYEDGIVISESYAKRAAHYTTFEISVPIKANDTVNFITKIGTQVTSKDVLVNRISNLRGRPSLVDAYDKGIMSPLKLNKSTNNAVVPNNINTGYVVDVSIQMKPNAKINDDYTRKVLEEYPNHTPNKDYLVLPEIYRNSKASKVKIEGDNEAVIVIKLVVINLMSNKSKVCNSWGSKGVISKVLPDSEMPYRKSDGRIADMLLNPASIISRKNPSQLYEAALSKVIHSIYDNMTVLLQHEEDLEVAKNYLRTYYGNKFDNYNYEDLIRNHEKGLQGYRIKVGSYSSITYKKLQEWMDNEGVSETDEVISPVLGEIEEPVVTGEIYMMKLYHSADFSGKVTSSIRDSREPYMGKGIYRGEGQRIGEMELWSLLSHGTEDFVMSNKDITHKSQYGFLTDLLMTGYVMSDPDGLPFLSQYRSKVAELKNKMNKKKDQ